MASAEHGLESPEGEHPSQPARGSSAPPSHRRQGNAQVALPPRTLKQEVWDDPRQPAFVILGGLAAVAWGSSALFTNGPTWHRALGLLSAMAGVLVLVSYFLRFHPALLAAERWTKTRPRRALRAVFAHAWAIFLGAAFVAWLVDFLAN